MTSAALAREVEVTQRTILRDVDALTEAGLPIVVHRGSNGGIELGFNYRTRLTGLAADEAEAIGALLGVSHPVARQLGIDTAARRATGKLIESFPDVVREQIVRAMQRFRSEQEERGTDPRVAALVRAIREFKIVRINANTPDSRAIHPVALVLTGRGWLVVDERARLSPIPLADCGDLNISNRRFSAEQHGPTPHR